MLLKALLLSIAIAPAHEGHDHSREPEAQPAPAAEKAVKVKSAPCPDGGKYQVHLTFDDGPVDPGTGTILGVLLKRNIKATFFLSTIRFRNAGPNSTLRDLVKRMKDEGHTIGNHSFKHIEHANLKVESADDTKRNLEMNDEMIKGLGLKMPIPFRFPFGSGWFQDRKAENQAQANKVMAEIKKRGFTPTHWDIDTWDWSKIKRKALPDSVLNQICSHKGGIILMHDVLPFTQENLGNIIDSIQASGHKIVPFDRIKRYSASTPLTSFADKTAGIFSCGRPVDNLDQIWPTCEAYMRNSSDVKGTGAAK